MVMPGSRSVSGATGWRLRSDWYSSSPWRWIFCGSMGCPVKGKSGAVGLGQEVADEARKTGRGRLGPGGGRGGHQTGRVVGLPPGARGGEPRELAVGNPLAEPERVL